MSIRSRVGALLGLVAVFTALLDRLGPEHFHGLEGEDPDDRRERIFHRLYLVLSTLSTVGYGDVHPKTRPARAAVMLLMLTSLGLALA